MIRLDALKVRVGRRVVRVEELFVPRGGIGRLMGPTGAGKTTLLECVCGLIPSTSGRIWIGERDVTDLPPASRGIGYAPQTPTLFDHLNVRQNVAFGMSVRKSSRREVDERVESLADRLGLLDLLDRRPRGLSGGEQRRVAVARAMAFRPTVLLLDEPTAGLDASAAARVAALLESERVEGATVLEVTHDQSTAPPTTAGCWQVVVRQEVAQVAPAFEAHRPE